MCIRDSEYSERNGFYIGIIPTVSLSKKISFLAEVQYSEEGYSLSNIQSFKTRNIRARVLPQIEYRLIKPIGLMAGLNFGLQLAELTKIDDGDWGNLGLNSFPETDFGYTLGARLHLNKFHITARFNQGIKDINELTFTDMNGSPIGDVTLKSQHYQIGVGYTFGG